MTRSATPEKGQPILEPLDEQRDHVRGPSGGPLIVEYGVHGTPTLFIGGVVHLGRYDATTLTEALAG